MVVEAVFVGPTCITKFGNAVVVVVVVVVSFFFCFVVSMMGNNVFNVGGSTNVSFVSLNNMDIDDNDDDDDDDDDDNDDNDDDKVEGWSNVDEVGTFVITSVDRVENVVKFCSVLVKIIQWMSRIIITGNIRIIMIRFHEERRQ
jgi:hypothetical protein